MGCLQKKYFVWLRQSGYFSNARKYGRRAHSHNRVNVRLFALNKKLILLQAHHSRGYKRSVWALENAQGKMHSFMFIAVQCPTETYRNIKMEIPKIVILMCIPWAVSTTFTIRASVLYGIQYKLCKHITKYVSSFHFGLEECVRMLEMLLLFVNFPPSHPFLSIVSCNRKTNKFSN